MPFITLNNPAVGDATRQSLIVDIIANLGFLNSQVSIGSTVKHGRNSNFEIDTDSDGTPDGFAITDYSTGSHSIDTTVHAVGKQSVKFTSTVLADGGGYIEDDDFQPIPSGEVVPWYYWRKADKINVSSRLEIDWYDNTQTLISTTNVFTDTDTPTTLTRKNGSATAPTTARYMKRRLIGAVPAVGTAVGDVWCDGINSIDLPPLMEGNIGSAAVNQAALKTATSAQSVSIAANNTASLTLAGGTYSLDVSISGSFGGVNPDIIHFAGGDLAAGIYGFGNQGVLSRSAYVDSRYIQSSPPWRFGSGLTETDEIELFAMLILDRSTGEIYGISVAPDPPWAYNGPTDISSTHKGVVDDGKGGQIIVPMCRELVLPHAFQDTVNDSVKRAEYDAAMAACIYQDVVVDMDYKNRDMTIIPHCWKSGSAIDDPLLPNAVPVMLNPFNAGTYKLAHLLATGEKVHEILENYLNFGDTVVMDGSPPGVGIIDWSWKP